MKKLKKLGTRFVSAVLVMLLLATLIPAGTIFVNAAENFYAKKLGGDSVTYYSSLENAWNSLADTGGTVGLLQDAETSTTLTVFQSKGYILEMNGHRIDRGLVNEKVEQNNGTVIEVAKGGELVVYGGTRSNPEPDNYLEYECYKNDRYCELVRHSTHAYHRGLITGGHSSYAGGGIAIEESASVELNYVTVAGNRSGGYLNDDGGCGGGIALRGDNARFKMYDSNVSYNFAERGGGVCVCNAKNSTVTLERSYSSDAVCDISANVGRESGGGVAICGDSGGTKIDGYGSRPKLINRISSNS
ncbi:MAG: hypothetical protein K6F88_03040, partial [Ruminococcus sp.]|nr:hypothetical protein [Ruminococcus sp.]